VLLGGGAAPCERRCKKHALCATTCICGVERLKDKGNKTDEMKKNAAINVWRSSSNIAMASVPTSRVFLQFLAIWGNESNNGQQETSLTRFRRTSCKILTDESRRAHRNQLRRLRPVVPQKRELTYRSENVQNWHRRSGLETKYVHTTRSLLESRKSFKSAYCMLQPFRYQNHRFSMPPG